LKITIVTSFVSNILRFIEEVNPKINMSNKIIYNNIYLIFQAYFIYKVVEIAGR
jgi:hypothetical protein